MVWESSTCSRRSSCYTGKSYTDTDSLSIQRSIRYCRESAVVLRPPPAHFLDGLEDAFRRLRCFVAGQGEDKGHEVTR